MGIVFLCLLFAGLGLLLRLAGRRFRAEGSPLADALDALLPQTQCGQCGYRGCRPYAEAIARGDADIDRCPPGGQAGIEALAERLGVEPKPLRGGDANSSPKHVAFIVEDSCIGCTKCIQACPVDAIAGAPQLMHTVIAAECTGCDLCIPPCPVDCIERRPALVPDATPSVLAAASSLLAGGHAPLPCIRCGFCADVCPSDLLPQQLYWYASAGNLARAESHRLFDCTECGGCDAVCPSGIPLTRQFREAKAVVMARRRSRAAAGHARLRFESRNQRKHQDQQRRADEARRRTESLGKPGAAEVAAAIERAKARKQAARRTRDAAVSGSTSPDEAPGSSR